MNYLLIGGADGALKREVIRLYARKLNQSADFDLVKGKVPDKESEPFTCAFTNRITQKTVWINSEKLTPAVFQEITYFKSTYPPNDVIVTLIPSPDAPDRTTLMENFDVTPDDDALEISLDNLPGSDASHLKHAADELEDILTKAPYNLL
ncbi:MAG: hypothetical protein RR202_09110 [Bacteroidales bacterium]